jgi:2-oxoglutarate dehydrogenase E2 component (dihydrolipoamide succinyltransferase)
MSTTLDIRAPADQTEGTRSQVLRWLKAVGDSVSEHEPLIEIETDKVTVEVAAPASGVLSEIVKAEQEEIEPGDVLGRLAPSVASVQEDVPTRVDAQAHAQPSHTGALSADAVEPAEPHSTTPGALQRLSPAVRRLIGERGLDPSVIQGTGEGGRITIDDVIAHSAPSSALAPAPAPARSPAQAASASAAESKPAIRASATAPTPAAHDQGEPSARSSQTVASRTIPHTAIRKRIADHMVQSLLQTAPHVTTVFEADLTAVLTHRATHRASFDERGAPLTLTAYFLSATVAAIRAVPEANSRWTESALEIFDSINIGVATAIEGKGLVVPVLHNVESLDLFGIAERLNELVTAAREGTLEPSNVRGGTFTISNHGVSGSLLATPIVINQPQSAILGIGKMEKRAVVVEEGNEERVVIRPKCYVTLTIDHRVMDGHQANHFLQVFVRTLEAWPAS